MKQFKNPRLSHANYSSFRTFSIFILHLPGESRWSDEITEDIVNAGVSAEDKPAAREPTQKGKKKKRMSVVDVAAVSALDVDDDFLNGF